MIDEISLTETCMEELCGWKQNLYIKCTDSALVHTELHVTFYHVQVLLSL